MNITEIEERYNKSITALKSLEQILKSQEALYDTHITRLSWLKHLADSCGDLKRYEVEAIRSAQIAAQVAQQQAQREAQAKAAAEESARLAAQTAAQAAAQAEATAQLTASPPPTQTLQDPEPTKRSKAKKAE
jgi:hypothetical protein